MEKKLDWENSFKDKFHESWHLKIKPAIESEWMYDIYQVLKYTKDRIVPESENTFRSFKECSLDEIKAVLVLSDPYPWVKGGVVVSDGIPLSCSNTRICQPSLSKFYESMETELGEEVRKEPDLSYLLHQGVFMINTALTVKVNKVGSHNNPWIWEPFIKYLFEEIFFVNTGVVYWLMGREAKRVLKWTNPLGNYIYLTDHPAAASHKETEWDSKGIFKLINKIIKSNGQDSIVWNYGEYKKILDEVPF